MSNIIDPNVIYESILKDNPPVTIHEQIYWIVEGDVMMDKAQIRSYAVERAEEALKRQQGKPVDESKRLLARAGAGGRIIRWSKGKVLTYCVRKATFNNTEYQQVVKAMSQATSDWEATCAIKFRHLVEFDESIPANSEPPLFDVQRANQDPNLLAWAFFPDDDKSLRHVWIETAFFNSQRNPYTMEGVLRHELGHVLGFRHEHIREGAPFNCKKYAESTANTVTLTPFDPTSVMHYMCPNVQMANPKWLISAKDKEGAQAVYGTPDGKLVPLDDKMDYKD